MEQRTIIGAAIAIGLAFVGLVALAPSFLKNEPRAEVAQEKHEKSAKVEAAAEPAMDDNDSDNEGRAEEPSVEEAEEAANPFGED
jgi:hypothetical protein